MRGRTSWRTAAVAALLLLFTLILWGCTTSEVFTPVNPVESSSATTSARTNDSSVPEGYQLFDGSEHGFVIALPSQWVPIDFTVTPEELEDQAGALGIDPEVLLSVKEVYGVGGFADVHLYAVLPGSDTRMLVDSRDALSGASIEFYEEILRNIVEFSQTLLSLDRVEVAGFEAVVAVYEEQSAGASTPAQTHEYHVITDDTVYQIIVRFEAGSADPQTATNIVNSFRVVGD